MKTAVSTPDVPVMGVFTPAFRLTDGELVVCSGIVPVDRDRQTVGVGDAAVQTRQILENLRAILKAADAELTDVVHLRVFSTDMANRQKINGVRNEFFSDPLPASTHVQITRLVDPEWLVEIEALAFVGR